MTITKRIASIALALIVTLTGFTMLTANQARAKTVNYTPKITYAKTPDGRKAEVRWNAPSKAYKNWNVQAQIGNGIPLGMKTKASYQYFYRSFSPYYRGIAKGKAKVRIRFYSGNNITKWSAYKVVK